MCYTIHEYRDYIEKILPVLTIIFANGFRDIRYLVDRT